MPEARLLGSLTVIDTKQFWGISGYAYDDGGTEISGLSIAFTRSVIKVVAKLYQLYSELSFILRSSMFPKKNLQQLFERINMLKTTWCHPSGQTDFCLFRPMTYYEYTVVQ
eukprot:12059964-Karenia_brevis.AAC.1